MRRGWMKTAFIGVALLLASFSLPSSILATTSNPVNIYLFWGEGCPHCAKAQSALAELDERYDNVTLYTYEVYYNSANQQLLQEVVNTLQTDASGVPVIIIGNQLQLGYHESMHDIIEQRVQNCSDYYCMDDVAAIVGLSTPQPVTTDEEETTEVDEEQDQDTTTAVETISLPLLGEIEVKDFSLPILTIIIAALDGFNPCAMWTLLFLISLLLGMENRRRMWALGSTFVVSSAVVYFLFMAAWLNIFLFLGVVTWVKSLIGLVAIGAGGYFLYDFWNNRSAACRVTGSEKRQKVFEKIRIITHNRSFIIALVGIVILAFAVNLVELICSAGLPAIYTNILSLSELATWQYYGYLLLYILVFMADDLLVFIAAMVTMKMVGVHTSYARYAHLVGGAVMLILGVLLIFAPQLLMFG